MAWRVSQTKPMMAGNRNSCHVTQPGWMGRHRTLGVSVSKAPVQICLITLSKLSDLDCKCVIILGSLSFSPVPGKKMGRLIPRAIHSIERLTFKSTWPGLVIEIKSNLHCLLSNCRSLPPPPPPPPSLLISFMLVLGMMNSKQEINKYEAKWFLKCNQKARAGQPGPRSCLWF